MTLATSFQGARRLSARNDDVLSFDTQEVENTIDKSLQYCEKIASKLNSVNQLPQACHKYASVVERIEDEQKSMNQAFAGMHAGAAQRAKVNRLKGYETQAQFQRRMTRSHKMSGSSY